MWQFFYLQARQMADDRALEAAQERLARDATHLRPHAGSRFAGFRRSGAVVAAGIARRLDECVAREELGLRSDERIGATS